MPIVLRPRTEIKFPFCVQHVTPDRLHGKSPLEIGKIPISIGNRQSELGELFEVQSSPTGDLVFDGDFRNSRFLGCSMKSGRIRVTGDAGYFTGQQMMGGQLLVEGSVRDYAGAEMSGGELIVAGNAGDFLAAALLGSKTGMNRGLIHIRGNAGSGVGYRMRRGFVVVEGNADSHLGWQMRAGTILCFGTPAESPPAIGQEMIRGTIVCPAHPQIELLPTFVPSYVGHPPVLGLLESQLSQATVGPDRIAALRRPYRLYSGDLLTGGRGEVFVPTE